MPADFWKMVPGVIKTQIAKARMKNVLARTASGKTNSPINAMVKALKEIVPFTLVEILTSPFIVKSSV
ncbi:hypothetical protein [Liquorilactobacillus uvarum]|uniref:Uncharacterized protein n=1 Tax=Liquorilactobacillus uvarum DSM 19971 TaxID=1423812 RepID=A0A0R1PU89_9LACO|nr:hypothetical protein [Liquorilactobacillus uvarum]KRL36033.1 hypothetical protein FD20_GL001462 [Liquorilactobacillus uvarum DSM 19971]